MKEDTGYIQGGGLISPCRNIFYLKIPKNASTYLNNILLANNWEEWNLYKDPPPTSNSIVFLRDPLERWISGFATYAALRIFGYGYGSDHFLEDYNDLVQRIIFDQIIFDDHTDLQVKYIAQVCNLNPIYFRCNKNLLQQLNKFLGYELNTANEIISNHSDDNYDTRQIVEFLKNKLIENPDLKARIIKCYQVDYDFINTIKFYNDPR